MFSSNNLTAQESMDVQRAKNLAKTLSMEQQISQETAQRIVYMLVLRKLGESLGEELPYADESCGKSYLANLAVVDEIAKNVQINHTLLDILFEELFDLENRKKFGQFLTPDYIADFMSAWLLEDKPCQILDPAVGTGIFLENIIKKLPNGVLPKLQGLDIDPVLLNASYIRLILDQVPKENFDIRMLDFIGLSSLTFNPVDAVICNPPYLNFHNFDRNDMVGKIEKRLGIQLSRLTNIYVLFFLQAFSLLKTRGRLAFITPSEFLYTGYGQELKKFLLTHTTIDALIVMDFESTVFNKALSTAVITLFRKQPATRGHKVKLIKVARWTGTKYMLDAVNLGSQDTDNYRMLELEQDKLNPNEKWLEHFVTVKNGHVVKKLVPLSKLATIKRGIATGHNNFFMLKKQIIAEMSIDREFLVPAVSRATQIKGYKITTNQWEQLAKSGESVYLLYIFEKPTPNVLRYIKHGEQIGANNRYITKHRLPWYSMENREPPEILATVFHRENMKFIHNEAKVRNLATFHCVYPKFSDTLMVKALLAYLNSDLCQDIQAIKRREYGGGLHKFEPRDLEKIPTLDVTQLDRSDVEKLATFFDLLANDFNDKEKIRVTREKLDDLLQHLIANS